MTAPVSQLLAQLRSTSWEEAKEAATLLAEVPGGEVTAALARALGAENAAVTEAAVAALVGRDDEASTDLM